MWVMDERLHSYTRYSRLRLPTPKDQAAEWQAGDRPNNHASQVAQFRWDRERAMIRQRLDARTPDFETLEAEIAV